MLKNLRLLTPASLLLGLLTLGLAACDDSSKITSGSGSQKGDGGDPSAKYAGTYRGQAAFQYSGGGLDGQSDLETIIIVINRNGTVSTTIAETTISGVINNNKVEIILNIDRSQDGVSCDAKVTLKGTVSGRKLSGPVSGKGDCKYLGVPRKVTLGGSFSATKI